MARKKEKTFGKGENVGQGEVYRERVVERKERERGEGERVEKEEREGKETVNGVEEENK